MRKRERKNKPYKVIGAYDSETTNIVDGLRKRAFPMLHQLGILSCNVEDVTPANVESCTRIDMYRHAVDLYGALDVIASDTKSYVPVIACHNLSFDMYGLANYFEGKQQEGYEVRVLAKSVRKPITFTVVKDKSPVLVIWDTLVFAQKSLAYMGEECGYAKLSGDWDYTLIRTPETPLSDKEIAYASHDVYALLAWLGYWCRLNPDIDPEKLGLNVVTKTGVVRTRRYQRFSKLRPQGQRSGKTVGDYWLLTNKTNMFRTDDELFTFNTATRGGFTFCASKHASQVYDFANDDARSVYGYDATSQHPSQIVSHKYPDRFHACPADLMRECFTVVAATSADHVLAHYSKPFPVAFDGKFWFKKLRVKQGSVFESQGIAPLASARFRPYEPKPQEEAYNGDAEEFKGEASRKGYADTAVNPVFAFGKLFAAEYCELYLTELAAWEVAQAYEWDDMGAFDGYETSKFVRPTDMAVVSVMQFYGAKNAFKQARGYYYSNMVMPAQLRKKLLGYNVPKFVVDGMCDLSIDEQTVESTYLGLKADLNALFGVEACNEYRRDTVLEATGIAYEGDFGVDNAPKNPKAWYQCGQRIVGWSRIAQVLVMLLTAPYIDDVVNGDTDSIKLVFSADREQIVEKSLSQLSAAIDHAKKYICARVKARYPQMYEPLDGIGYYVREFEVKRFAASWNKAYCMDDCGKLRFTIAGVPVGHGVAESAQRMYDGGTSFGEVCDRYLGYNVTYPHSLTGLNARAFPDWGAMFDGYVTDHAGRRAHVVEPGALCLYPMAKTINDTHVVENVANMRCAVRNRPTVSTEPCMLTATGFRKLGDLIG